MAKLNQNNLVPLVTLDRIYFKSTDVTVERGSTIYVEPEKVQLLLDLGLAEHAKNKPIVAEQPIAEEEK